MGGEVAGVLERRCVVMLSALVDTGGTRAGCWWNAGWAMLGCRCEMVGRRRDAATVDFVSY